MVKILAGITTDILREIMSKASKNIASKQVD